MAYCSKCGTKIEEDDIYCPNCGTRRIDIDDDSKSHRPNPNDRSADAGFKEAAIFFVNMFLKPITTAQKFVGSGKKNTAIILTVFTAVMQGFLEMWKMGQLVSNINNIVMQLTNSILKITQLIYPSASPDSINDADINEAMSVINRIKSNIKVPYGDIFLENCILVLVSILASFAIICLANTLFSKSKPRIFKFYKTALIAAVPIIYFEFLSILFSYFSIGLGMALMLFGFIDSVVCFAVATNKSLAASQNCILFVTSFTSVAVIFITLVFFQRFMPSILSTIVSSIMDNIKNLNLQ